MEEITMSDKYTPCAPDGYRSGASPEEKAILARFLTRVSGRTRKTVNALSQGSFLVL
jgi:hypothetical protein